jgi:hypothetical protein
MHAGRTPELVLAMVDDAACRCTGHRRGVHIECLKFSHNYIASVEAAKKLGSSLQLCWPSKVQLLPERSHYAASKSPGWVAVVHSVAYLTSSLYTQRGPCVIALHKTVGCWVLAMVGLLETTGSSCGCTCTAGMAVKSQTLNMWH